MTTPERAPGASMTGLLRLVARRAAGVLPVLFPSVPVADQARVLAAMEGRDFVPAALAGLLDRCAEVPQPWELSDERLATIVARWVEETR